MDFVGTWGFFYTSPNQSEYCIYKHLPTCLLEIMFIYDWFMSDLKLCCTSGLKTICFGVLNNLKFNLNYCGTLYFNCSNCLTCSSSSSSFCCKTSVTVNLYCPEYLPLAFAFSHRTSWVDVYVCSMDEQMSNVMRREMKGGGWEAASLQGHLTGVTLTADWLIPCPLSYPMMLRGRIAPKVMCANTWGNIQLAKQLYTHTHTHPYPWQSLGDCHISI